MKKYLTRDSWKPGTIDTWNDIPTIEDSGDFAFYHKDNLNKYAGSICSLVFKETFGLDVQPGKCYELIVYKNDTDDFVEMEIKEIIPQQDLITPSEKFDE